MRTSYRLKAVIVLLALLVLAGLHSSATASGPYEGRNFRFPVTDSDVVTVTFTDPLPVTSADTYFDIIIDGGFYWRRRCRRPARLHHRLAAVSRLDRTVHLCAGHLWHDLAQRRAPAHD